MVRAPVRDGASVGGGYVTCQFAGPPVRRQPGASAVRARDARLASSRRGAISVPRSMYIYIYAHPPQIYISTHPPAIYPTQPRGYPLPLRRPIPPSPSPGAHGTSNGPRSGRPPRASGIDARLSTSEGGRGRREKVARHAGRGVRGCREKVARHAGRGVRGCREKVARHAGSGARACRASW